MKKRVLSILLLWAMLISLASCGGSEGSGNDTTDAASGSDDTTPAAETTPFAPFDSYERRTFDGKTFTILEANWHPHLHINIHEGEMNGDIVNDALFQRDSKMEELYDIEIEYYQTKSSIEILKNTVLADEHVYDLVFSDIYQGFAPLATQGILYNLCDIDQLSLDQTWWSPLIYEQLTLNDNLYFTSGDITPAVYQAPLCQFLNLKLYENYNIKDDIFQMVLDGKWTMDAVQKITKDFDQDVNQDGMMHANDDLFGIVMQHTDESSDALTAAADVQLCTISGDGKSLVKTKLGDGNMVDALEKISKTVKFINYASINDVITKTFKEDRALILQHKLESAAVHLQDMESDYLILPMPKLDENQESYISCVSGYVCSFTAVPATADEDFTGFIAEAMARYSNQYIRPLAYDLVYKIKDTRDDRSAEVLDILFDTLYLDFNIVYNFGNSRTSLTNIIFNGMPIASTMAALDGYFDGAMDELANAWK